MAEIISRKNKKATPKVDLTPMVDLGFLLITFFILTNTMASPKALPLTMPSDGVATKLAESKSLNIVLCANDMVALYNGNDSTHIYKASFKKLPELRNMIMQKQKLVKQQFTNANELVAIIKPTTNCAYKNVIDALDEMKINGITKYMIVNASNYEEKL